MGGLLDPNYNHAANAISELTMAGVPNKLVLYVLFLVYNSLIIIFGTLLFLHYKRLKNRLMMIVGDLFFFVGLLGCLFLFFPQDPRGTPLTLGGMMHLVIAGVTSPTTLILMALTGWVSPKIFGDSKFRYIGYGMVLVVFLTGGMTAWSVSVESPILGIFERLTIGTFLLGTTILAVLQWKKTDEQLRTN